MKYSQELVTGIDRETLDAVKDRLWGRFIFNAAQEEDLVGELTLSSYSIRDIPVIVQIVKTYRETGVVVK